ncbi:[FeFe] hydrogenase H-cluster radical SAM maturase HydE [bacterium 1xD8-6]|nr:[FeFe] hydrogenase H-cluster radical SAM maturase HydE [bacterium D16-36]RKI71981.1 [FeFe] hydrogenase H-cluster radical SAM maturase HydE [bacterium 1xD8-6]
MNTITLIEKLWQDTVLAKEEYVYLIRNCSMEDRELLAARANEVRQSYYGKDVYVRGLIEFTNYCRNNCYYCGIRAENKNADRYRLSAEEILECVEEGYTLGFRTFVLQGGEDFSYSTEDIGSLIAEIKKRHNDCAVTLSLGERERDVYQYWYDCGADRYLLRHETASKEHYEKLHPQNLSFGHRIKCLYNLKEIGYQTGAGFMVGSPFQTAEHLAADLLFLKELQPHMAGIGPFIAQKDSPFAGYVDGTLEQTLLMLSLVRLTLPRVLLPSTTALGTIHPQGRELGILAGANVVMPNLSPVSVREKYQLYDNKICTGEESAQCRQCLDKRMESIGYHIVTARGDFANVSR